MIFEPITFKDFPEATLSPICFSNPPQLAFAPRRAVIVCPGGGYTHLSPREAEPIAAQFLAAGYAPFILRYSVGENAADFSPLKQLAMSVRHVRENAKKYSVDPDYVFVCGFSAGGHLCASLGTLWSSPTLDEVALGAPRDIIRPTGMILAYPLITSKNPKHLCCFRLLWGKEDLTKEELDAYSLEKHVGETTPPAFIWHTITDKVVPVENSLLFAQSLTAAGVPFEMHLFPSGPHGMALCNELTSLGKPRLVEPHAAQWMDLALRWIKDFEV